MNLFDQIVDEAINKKNELSPLRMVVEKELLHHDILRILNEKGLLSHLTFIGGTCLRLCYGSNRLSEDLDFTGGSDFNKSILADMSQVLINTLQMKYGLKVEISEPKRESGNVDTWIIKIQTRPSRKEIPSQRINIDICAIPSYQRKPTLLLNPYDIDMGTSGLIVHAESREEIFADKFIAFALRKNRIKYRDLWDIAWLHQHNIKLSIDLINNKINDHKTTVSNYLNLLSARTMELKNSSKLKQDFSFEMQRFLPADIIKNTVDQENYWQYLINLMSDYNKYIIENIKM